MIANAVDLQPDWAARHGPCATRVLPLPICAHAFAAPAPGSGARLGEVAGFHSDRWPSLASTGPCGPCARPRTMSLTSTPAPPCAWSSKDPVVSSRISRGQELCNAAEAEPGISGRGRNRRLISRFSRPGRRRDGTGNRPAPYGPGRVCRRRGRRPRNGPAPALGPELPARA